jgi:hypothetical protein
MHPRVLAARPVWFRPFVIGGTARGLLCRISDPTREEMSFVWLLDFTLFESKVLCRPRFDYA